MQSGAWPFLVRGAICLVNSDNERDLNVCVSIMHVSCIFDPQRISSNKTA